MKKNTFFSAFLLLCFFLVGCDERMALSVKSGGVSDGGSEGDQSSGGVLWASECYDIGWGNYARNYIHFSKLGISQVRGMFSDENDCESEENGWWGSEELWGMHTQILSEGWTILRLTNGTSRIFKAVGEKLIEIQNPNDYLDFVTLEFTNLDILPEDLLEHKKADSLPELDLPG